MSIFTYMQLVPAHKSDCFYLVIFVLLLSLDYVQLWVILADLD